MVAKTQDFSYDFPGQVINPDIFTVTGDPRVVNREAVMDDNDGLQVKQKYDLTNSYIFHKLEVEPGLVFIWSLDRDSRNKLGFIKRDTNLVFRIIKDGTPVDHIIPYVGTQHRWWRLRESEGTTYWDTSPNGKDWVTNYNAPTPFGMTSVTINYKVQGTGLSSDCGWGLGPWGTTPWGGCEPTVPTEGTPVLWYKMEDAVVDEDDIVLSWPAHDGLGPTMVPGGSFVGTVKRYPEGIFATLGSSFGDSMYTETPYDAPWVTDLTDGIEVHILQQPTEGSGIHRAFMIYSGTGSIYVATDKIMYQTPTENTELTFDTADLDVQTSAHWFRWRYYQSEASLKYTIDGGEEFDKLALNDPMTAYPGPNLESPISTYTEFQGGYIKEIRVYSAGPDPIDPPAEDTGDEEPTYFTSYNEEWSTGELDPYRWPQLEHPDQLAIIDERMSMAVGDYTGFASNGAVAGVPFSGAGPFYSFSEPNNLLAFQIDVSEGPSCRFFMWCRDYDNGHRIEIQFYDGGLSATWITTGVSPEVTDGVTVTDPVFWVIIQWNEDMEAVVSWAVNPEDPEVPWTEITRTSGPTPIPKGGVRFIAHAETGTSDEYIYVDNIIIQVAEPGGA